MPHTALLLLIWSLHAMCLPVLTICWWLVGSTTLQIVMAWLTLWNIFKSLPLPTSLPQAILLTAVPLSSPYSKQPTPSETESLSWFTWTKSSTQLSTSLFTQPPAQKPFPTNRSSMCTPFQALPHWPGQSTTSLGKLQFHLFRILQHLLHRHALRYPINMTIPILLTLLPVLVPS